MRNVSAAGNGQAGNGSGFAHLGDAFPLPSLLPPCSPSPRPRQGRSRQLNPRPWAWLAAARQVVPAPLLLLDSSSFASTAPRSFDVPPLCMVSVIAQ